MCVSGTDREGLERLCRYVARPAVATERETNKAIGYYEQCLAIARQTGDKNGEGRALGNLGVVYADLGETAKAEQLARQALELGRATGAPSIIDRMTRLLDELGS